jgi:hypothetical protein
MPEYYVFDYNPNRHQLDTIQSYMPDVKHISRNSDTCSGTECDKYVSIPICTMNSI